MNCEHPVIKKLINGEFEGSVPMPHCLVAHYFPDGSIKPACWRCEGCNRWISYEEREKMKAKE